MPIFSRFFESQEARAAKEIIKNTRRRFAPFFSIQNAIIKAAGACGEAVKSLTSFPSEKENQENWLYVQFEFVYFFMHLTNRSAFSILGPEGRNKLQNELSLLIVGSIFDAMVGHWPQKFKDGIRHDFLEKLNNAELEYGACKEFLSTDNPFAGDGLLNKLALNVAGLVGKPMDQEVIVKVISVASESFAQMKLNEMMNDLKESGFLYSSVVTESELAEARAALAVPKSWTE